MKRWLRIALSDRRWLLGPAGFLLAIAYCPFGGNREVVLRSVIAAVVPWVLLPWTKPPSIAIERAGPPTVFLAWMAVSVFWSHQPYDAIEGLIQLGIVVGAFLLGASWGAGSLYVGLGLGIPIAMLLGGFHPNVDLGGEAAAVATVGLAAVGYPLAILPLVAILLGHSKGALLGVLAAGLVGFRSWWMRGLLVGVAGLAIGLKASHQGLASSAERWRIWQDAWAGTSWFGNGLGATYTAFPFYATHQDPLVKYTAENVHNDFLQILFEQGYIGGLLAIAAFGSLVYGQSRSVSGLVLITVCAMAMVGFPFHVPITLFVAAFAAGGLCRGVVVYEPAGSRGMAHARELWGRIAANRVGRGIGRYADIPVHLWVSVKAYANWLGVHGHVQSAAAGHDTDHPRHAAL